VDKLGDQVRPLIQALFLNKDAVFQDNSPIHTAGSIQSWFEEHENVLQRVLWPNNHQISTTLNHSGQFWRPE
jgi:hypothetical protein